uniref:STAR protein homodimerisation region domain-containing protein n=1 Tax=Phlebotomus papatasi TaxID=29031 RepID=A0A1B0D6P4_PHLPP
MNTDNNNTQQSTQSIADYLAQLLKDRKQLAAFPNVFNHVERLLDEEIFEAVLEEVSQFSPRWTQKNVLNVFRPKTFKSF